mmetsp:Transcript_14700/g.46046  ORF Transcript_14700/g.46046 Transcript_14700/m.46046 type:complete len:203 (+) Transcript_14700:184-792(+)
MHTGLGLGDDGGSGSAGRDHLLLHPHPRRGLRRRAAGPRPPRLHRRREGRGGRGLGRGPGDLGGLPEPGLRRLRAQAGSRHPPGGAGGAPALWQHRAAPRLLHIHLAGLQRLGGHRPGPGPRLRHRLGLLPVPCVAAVARGRGARAAGPRGAALRGGPGQRHHEAGAQPREVRAPRARRGDLHAAGRQARSSGAAAGGRAAR